MACGRDAVLTLARRHLLGRNTEVATHALTRSADLCFGLRGDRGEVSARGDERADRGVGPRVGIEVRVHGAALQLGAREVAEDPSGSATECAELPVARDQEAAHQESHACVLHDPLAHR